MALQIPVTVTCPQCRMPIRFDHALTTVTDPDGGICVLLDKRAMGMHDCFRDER